ncbi:MAG: alpha-galactosidase [Clostridiaceae bacterium]|nr:alpha-galactosidase [Clostridiaceae bacterium]
MMKNYANFEADQWYRILLTHPEDFPFSFTYNGTRYDGFSAGTLREAGRHTVCGEKKETTELIFVLPDGLLVTLQTACYPAYGVSEWTVWFENAGRENSGILEKVESTLTFTGRHPVLKGILGDHVNLYRPYAHDLENMPVHFLSDSGRPTHINFPYFNLEYGEGGVMLAIGWAGTWAADFVSDGETTTYKACSTNALRTYLKPGEKIRTALFVRAPYTVRNENYATNFWRSWFVNCNLPASDASGNPIKPFSSCCLASDTGLPNSDGSISERSTTWRPSLEKMLAEDVGVDFRWLDAGWYAAPDGSSPVSDWWGTVGTWVPDPVKWPGNTLRESTDFAREHDMKTLMWFEPERVTDPESLAQNYGYHPEWAIRRDNIPAISNNIGIPACLEWTTERICKVLRENKVEMYREDNNSDPGMLWRYLDTREGENRTGITECKFVIGHYKMWDDIIVCTLSFGGCGFVDSCASGGGRNDLESLRRGIPLLRSDYDRTTAALRLSMTTAFNKWIPFCGANTKEKESQLAAIGRSDVYTWRASYLPALNVDAQFVQDPGQNFDMLRFGLQEWKKLSPYLLKDFYVLTPWHSQEDKSGFTAYSFFDSDTEQGALLLFRMEDCPEDRLTVALPYAEDNGVYTLTDEDSGESFTQSGSALKKTGCTFILPECRTALLVWIGIRK